ncbi:alpha/beta hydrolase [Ruegeria sp.]|uniref:alpha/beta hydrolase n=1 Tax=Ruegeria sp. TaxID=1879320 RepID=UPI003B0004D0
MAALADATAQALASDEHVVMPDVSYGARPRQKIDVFAPVGATKAPCLVFIHGGFWQEGAKDVSGFAACNFTTHGWAYVSVGYTLTPDVSLTELTSEIYQVLDHLRKNADRYNIDAGKIVLSGHSAGGHLTASVLAEVLGQGAAAHLVGAVMVSGVFDLEPIARSYVNDLARISPEEADRLSPARHAPKKDIPVHLVIGADEPEAFQVQTAVLADLWQQRLTDLSCTSVPGRDHFDILEVLADPKSETFQTIQNMIGDHL